MHTDEITTQNFALKTHCATDWGSHLAEEISEIGDRTINPLQTLRQRGHERRGKRSSARGRNHTRPSTAPRQERGSSQGWGCLPGPGVRHLFHKPQRLFAPPPASFDAHNNQLTPAFVQEPQYFVSLSRRALKRVAPLTVERWLWLLQMNSTRIEASWPPWFRGNPEARTSISLSSEAGTVMFISRNLALHRTVAPASRHTRASVFSVAVIRLLNLPDLPQIALCLPHRSNLAPHSQCASVTCCGRRSLSRISVRKNKEGWIWNSGAARHPQKTSPDPPPK